MVSPVIELTMVSFCRSTNDNFKAIALDPRLGSSGAAAWRRPSCAPAGCAGCQCDRNNGQGGKAALPRAAVGCALRVATCVMHSLDGLGLTNTRAAAGGGRQAREARRGLPRERRHVRASLCAAAGRNGGRGCRESARARGGRPLACAGGAGAPRGPSRLAPRQAAWRKICSILKRYIPFSDTPTRPHAPRDLTFASADCRSAPLSASVAPRPMRIGSSASSAIARVPSTGATAPLLLVMAAAAIFMTTAAMPTG